MNQRRKKLKIRALVVEGLEERRVLAASAGWDGPGAGSAFLSKYIDQAANSFHNHANPLDVNEDESVSPIDALLVINELNTNQLNQNQVTSDSAHKCDTNGDGAVSPVDALIVINGLNESSGTSVVAIDDSDDTVDSIDDSDESDSTDDDDSDLTDDSGSGDSTDDELDTDHPHHRHPFGSGGFGLGFISPERVEGLFDRFDDNADDLLTEDEVPSRIWTQWIDDGVDTNDDAAVSIAEVNAAIRAKQQEKFDALDDDGDGRLVETEVSSRLWQMLTDGEADTDADGGISLDELLVLQETRINQVQLPIYFGSWLTPERVDGLFQRFDKNSDQLLTEDEVPAFLWSHWVDKEVDTDGDSAISVDEVNAAIRVEQKEKFDAVDTDGDGLLSESEVSERLWRKLTDGEADADGDGSISFDELLEFQLTDSSESNCDHTTANEAIRSSLQSVASNLRQSGVSQLAGNVVRILARRFR